MIDAGTRHDMYVAGDMDMLQFVSPGDLDNDCERPRAERPDAAVPARRDLLHRAESKSLPALAMSVSGRRWPMRPTKQKIRSLVFAGKRDVAQDILAEGIPGFDPLPGPAL